MARRRALLRERILEAAARRFAASSADWAGLERVADEADIARGTLYSFFPTKDDLVREILRPVLERAVDRAERIVAETMQVPETDPMAGLDRLLKLYFELWRDFPDPFRLTYRMTERSLGPLEALHGRFLRAVFRIFESPAMAGRLRVGEPALAARVLAQTAVPLLDVCASRPDGESLFVEGMRGLLMGDPVVR